MNISNNKRRKQSQEKIEKVFIELIQKKDINKISVTDIVKLAKINRSTFYANYLDIYDLADKIKEKLEQDVFKLYEDEIINNYNSNNYLKLFKHIKENQIFYKTYFKLGYDVTFKITKYDTKLAKEHFDNKYIDYHIEFFKSGLTAIIKKWLNSGCQESPEEINEILHLEYNRKN